MNKLYLQKLCLIISDVLALVLSFIISHRIVIHYLPLTPPISFNTIGIAKAVGLLAIAVFWYQEQYSKRRPNIEELRLIYKTIFVFALLHLCISYLTNHQVVKLLNIIFWLVVLFLLPLLRNLTKLLLLKTKLWYRDLYIIGTGESARAAALLLQEKLLGYRLKAFIAVELKTTHSMLHGQQAIPVLDFNDFLSIKGNSGAEIVFSVSSQELLNKVSYINLLQSKYMFVSIIPDIYGLPIYGAELNHFFANEQLMLRLQNNLGRRFNYIIKRVMDLVLSLLVVIIISPLLLGIILALVISTKRFKIFYGHKRIGRDGAKFMCLKFRTMHINSKQILDELLASNVQAKLEWQENFKLKQDPRVTKIGSLLRRTSLDELPQLFNVIKGEMSLVGPRPIVQEEIARYKESFYYYKLVRPGISGLWQISGRNDIDYEQRVRLDVWYVKNWSLWYDIVILLSTFSVVLSRVGAY